jgi:predicted RNase H-like nuclease (RuvC/YqgF family)
MRSWLRHFATAVAFRENARLRHDIDVWRVRALAAERTGAAAADRAAQTGRRCLKLLDHLAEAEGRVQANRERAEKAEAEWDALAVRVRELLDQTERQADLIQEREREYAALRRSMVDADNTAARQEPLRDAVIARLEEQGERDRAEIERLERELGEANTTIEGLGQANTALEQRLERRQFLDEDAAHARLMDGAGDQ